ncbi:MAG TPA: ABC transporter permease [Vicinamibacterales bacterium]|nr:ABC transporter permease [Vicinamibacterales bacterium]
MKVISALRGLRGQRPLILAAVASLAIGIGANTAIFSVLNALLLRPLEYRDADRLTILWNRSPGLNIQEDWFSTAQYFDIKRRHSGFDEVALAIGANYNLTGSGDPERVGVMRVSSNLLPMLGAVPEAGQLFVPEDDVPGRPLTAILSHDFWVRRFGADRAVIGQSIVLNGQTCLVIGVLPARFHLPREVLPTLGLAEDGEIFLPLPLPPTAPDTRTREDYNILAKLKRGVSVERAQAEMDGITASLRRDFPDIYPPHGGLTFSVVPLLDQVTGRIRPTVLVTMGAVACVLLIACANVANLLLSRALARRRELAIRAALGASRWRLVGQLLREAVVLSCAGGVAGAILAWLGLAWLRALGPADVPRLHEIAIDARVLVFTALVSMTAGVLAGLAPALGLRRVDIQRTLRDAGRGASGARSFWGAGGYLRRGLVIVQLALAVTLLVGAGLLARTVAHLARVHPGFETARVLTFELTLTGARYANGPAVAQAYQDLWARLAGTAGVESAGGVSSLPLSGYFSWGPITVDGRVPPPGETFINADQRIAGGRYFETMGIALREGRWFDVRDTADSEKVVVVDEFMASELWPGVSALGKRIRFGDVKSTTPWRTVVGVAGRIRQYALDQDDRIAVYLPHAQATTRAMYIAVRGNTAPEVLGAAVRQAVRDLDPNLPLYRVRPMSALVDASLARQRFALSLLGVFAFVALVLAAIGTYGVMSYVVAQGTREIGIRLALGASSRRVLGLVIGQGITVAGAGVAIGLGGAYFLTRLLGSLISGVGRLDPWTYSGVGITLAIVAVVASAMPALRASRIDPAVSLRNE